MRLQEVLLHSSLLLLCIPSVVSDSSEELCSEDKKNVNCVPCTEINSNVEPLYCPKQCTKHGQSFCNEACNKFCLNNRCEYEGGSLKCSDGCIDGLTGKYCYETCPENCTKCDQFTGECFCEGDYCTTKPTPKPTVRSKPNVRVQETKSSFKTSSTQSQNMVTTKEQTTHHLVVMVFRTTSAAPLDPDNNTTISVQKRSDTGHETSKIPIIATVSSLLVVAFIVTAAVLLIRRRRFKTRREEDQLEKNDNDYEHPIAACEKVYYTGLHTRDNESLMYEEI